MKFYGLKTCDTCRKAQKQLRAAHKNFDSIDVRADGVSVEKLAQWALQIDWVKLLNTRSTTWRNLDAVDKENMDKARALALMALHPTLIKRPVIEVCDKVYVGWGSDTQLAVL